MKAKESEAIIPKAKIEKGNKWSSPARNIERKRKYWEINSKSNIEYFFTKYQYLIPEQTSFPILFLSSTQVETVLSHLSSSFTKEDIISEEFKNENDHIYDQNEKEYDLKEANKLTYVSGVANFETKNLQELYVDEMEKEESFYKNYEEKENLTRLPLK